MPVTRATSRRSREDDTERPSVSGDLASPGCRRPPWPLLIPSPQRRSNQPRSAPPVLPLKSPALSANILRLSPFASLPPGEAQRQSGASSPGRRSASGFRPPRQDPGAVTGNGSKRTKTPVLLGASMPRIQRTLTVSLGAGSHPSPDVSRDKADHISQTNFALRDEDALLATWTTLRP